ncbi:tRNA (adenosine(37)-N6)-threonylcarbamoyltransferase complex ATPase subunit type 1 TsaE [Spiroplasma endosymbiont of Aspidapion aeneum]|uniref:tRNA (adenosine(37)-N6)-threonylcarbamoyltransferase complex ATPase subunit type 1 TsaE n=1 Tax=Spiroplasma endosymbiont of Aspidapion aeneum TaxID=3066276 RepID=UPI00313BCA4E
MLIKNVENLETVYKRIKKRNWKNTVILLHGRLGAGKTTFTKYILKRIGVKETISSPTFNIVNQYEVEGLSINHVDFFRLTKPISEDVDLVQELMKDRLSIIEWSENVELDYTGYDIIEIHIKIIDENCREFLIW